MPLYSFAFVVYMTRAPHLTYEQVGIAPAEGAQALAALTAFRRSGLLGPAGVLTTDANTGQQWDAPNAWPPLQDIVIEALENYGGKY
jgi:alpha,alpha-trehalase